MRGTARGYMSCCGLAEIGYTNHDSANELSFNAFFLSSQSPSVMCICGRPAKTKMSAAGRVRECVALCTMALAAASIGGGVATVLAAPLRSR